MLLTVIADRLFGFTVTRREWIGVALTAAGLAFLAATLGDTADSAHNDWDDRDAGPLRRRWRGARARRRGFAGRASSAGSLLAVAAGLTWGASDVSIKALSASVDDGDRASCCTRSRS